VSDTLDISCCVWHFRYVLLCLTPWICLVVFNTYFIARHIQSVRHSKTYPNQGNKYVIFCGVHVTRSLVLCVCFVYRCLSFCTFTFGHCVVCSSSINAVSDTLDMSCCVWHFGYVLLCLTLTSLICFAVYDTLDMSCCVWHLLHSTLIMTVF
jgi:hypothetical protein